MTNPFSADDIHPDLRAAIPRMSATAFLIATVAPVVAGMIGAIALADSPAQALRNPWPALWETRLVQDIPSFWCVIGLVVISIGFAASIHLISRIETLPALRRASRMLRAGTPVNAAVLLQWGTYQGSIVPWARITLADDTDHLMVVSIAASSGLGGGVPTYWRGIGQAYLSDDASCVVLKLDCCRIIGKAIEAAPKPPRVQPAPQLGPAPCRLSWPVRAMVWSHVVAGWLLVVLGVAAPLLLCGLPLAAFGRMLLEGLGSAQSPDSIALTALAAPFVLVFSGAFLLLSFIPLKTHRAEMTALTAWARRQLRLLEQGDVRDAAVSQVWRTPPGMVTPAYTVTLAAAQAGNSLDTVDVEWRTKFAAGPDGHLTVLCDRDISGCVPVDSGVVSAADGTVRLTAAGLARLAGMGVLGVMGIALAVGACAMLVLAVFESG